MVLWRTEGRKNGIIYRNRGLIYHLLDDKGNKAGIPIKASAIYNKPTLTYLERKFRENAVQKQVYKRRLQKTVDWAMLRPPTSLAALEKMLQTENITLVFRQNETGFVYGLTYIDQRTKCVFNDAKRALLTGLVLTKRCQAASTVSS